jgi:hypothetical protein
MGTQISGFGDIHQGSGADRALDADFGIFSLTYQRLTLAAATERSAEGSSDP